MHDYSNFEVEDFVLDAYFQNWILKPNAETEAFWKQWEKEHPEKAPIIEEATTLLKQIQFSAVSLTPEQKTEIKQNLLHRIKIKPLPSSNKPKNSNLWWYSGVVATVLAGMILLILFLPGIHQKNTRKFTLLTQTGEQKSMALPDGSKVIVYENSKLIYPKSFENKNDRQVQLEGQAFFHIQKKKDSGEYVKFIVQIKQMNIEVLGTQFLVSQDNQKARVRLEEGKIRLYIKDQMASQLTLNPGEEVEYQSSQKELTQFCAQNESSITWKNNTITFNNTTLKEVSKVLKEHHAITLNFENETIQEEMISGTLPVAKIHLLFAMLEQGNEFKVVLQKENHFYIQYNK